MLILIFAVIFGLASGYFATQNTTPVTIRFAEYVIEAPLYLVAVGSLLVGLLMAWILYFARTVSSALTIYGKNHAVRKANQTVADLEQRVHELQTENDRLKGQPFAAPDTSIEHGRGNSWERIRA